MNYNFIIYGLVAIAGIVVIGGLLFTMYYDTTYDEFKNFQDNN